LRLTLFIFFKSGAASRETQFPGTLLVGLKSTFFGEYYRGVYFRLTVVGFFIETASFENSV